MKQERLAKRYAKALFYAANKQHIISQVQTDLKFIQELYESDQNLKEFLAHPGIPHSAKERVIQKVFSSRVQPLTLHCLQLLLRKRRDALFNQMTQEFQKLRNEQEGFLEIDIYSAVELEPHEKQTLIEKFEKGTLKKIVPHFYEDPSLIAGIKICYQQLQIDGSVQGGLRRLRDNLLHDNLKQAFSV